MCCHISLATLNETSSALLTPTIAVVGAYIAHRQWSTDKARLKHELFDRRHEIFLKIAGYLADIVCHTEIAPEAQIQFMKQTHAVRFLFDKQMKEYVDDIYKRSTRLRNLNLLLKSENDMTRRETNLKEQNQLEAWFMQELNEIEVKFEPYLSLSHE